MATHSSILAWRIPGRVEPVGLPVYGVAQSRARLKRLSSSSSPIQSVCLIVSQNPHKSTNISYTLANELYQQPQLADLSSQFSSVQSLNCVWLFVTQYFLPVVYSNQSTILPLKCQYYISSFVKTLFFFNLETYKIFFLHLPPYQGLSLVAQLVKNPPAMQETPV